MHEGGGQPWEREIGVIEEGPHSGGAEVGPSILWAADVMISILGPCLPLVGHASVALRPHVSVWTGSFVGLWPGTDQWAGRRCKRGFCALDVLVWFWAVVFLEGCACAALRTQVSHRGGDLGRL